MKPKHYIIIVLCLFIFQTEFIFAQNRSTRVQKKMALITRQLEFAKDIQISFENKATADMLNQAEETIRRARRQWRAGRYGSAMKLLNTANNLTIKSLRLLLKEPVKNQEKKIDNIINEAKNLIEQRENPEAKRNLQKAIRNKKKAIDLFREDKFLFSLNSFRQAFFYGQKSIDMIKNKEKSVKDEAMDEAVQCQKLINKADKEIGATNNQTIIRNIKSGKKLSKNAENALNNKNYRLAIDNYHQATRLVLRAMNLSKVKSNQTATRAFDELAYLDELIENVQNRVKLSENNFKVIFISQRIKQLQNDAQEALDNGNYELSLFNTRLTRNLIERIIKKRNPKNKFVDNSFIDEMQNLKKELWIIETRINKNRFKEPLLLIKYANRAYEKSEKLLIKKNFRMLNFAISIVRKFAVSADLLNESNAKTLITTDMVKEKVNQAEDQIKTIESFPVKQQRRRNRVLLNQAKEMMSLAQVNFKNNLLNVANECIEVCNIYIQKHVELTK